MSFGDELVCFEQDKAVSLLIDITACKDTTNILEQTIKLQDTKITGLDKDKNILKDESRTYKQLYTDTNAKLIKAEQDKPSRTTWALIGAGLATTITILMKVFVIK